MIGPHLFVKCHRIPCLPACDIWLVDEQPILPGFGHRLSTTFCKLVLETLATLATLAWETCCGICLAELASLTACPSIVGG